MKKCLVIDGNNLLYRCYHAAQHLTHWESDFKTIFVFLRVMISFLKGNDYQGLIVFFDNAKINFRHSIFGEYKINRLATSSKLIQQLEIVQNLLNQTGIFSFKLENFEADDLIASFVTQNNSYDLFFDILSQDKDLMQLLSPQVNICKYIDKKNIVYSYGSFLKEYEFLPTNYVDYLSLLGDKSDNIPGLEGIGSKKSQQLIKQFTTVENLYQNINFLPEKNQELFKKNHSLAIQNKQLIALKKDLILPINWEQWSFAWEKWRRNKQLIIFCQKHQFNSILKLLANETFK